MDQIVRQWGLEGSPLQSGSETCSSGSQAQERPPRSPDRIPPRRTHTSMAPPVEIHLPPRHPRGCFFPFLDSFLDSFAFFPKAQKRVTGEGTHSLDEGAGDRQRLSLSLSFSVSLSGRVSGFFFSVSPPGARRKFSACSGAHRPPALRLHTHSPSR